MTVHIAYQRQIFQTDVANTHCGKKEKNDIEVSFDEAISSENPDDIQAVLADVNCDPCLVEYHKAVSRQIRQAQNLYELIGTRLGQGNDHPS